MRTVDVQAQTTAAAPGPLPHLRARPTIHADLLRPVRLNRTRTAGHPGGPPPAPVGRKRRKRQTSPSVDEGSLPAYFEETLSLEQTRASPSCTWRSGPGSERCPSMGDKGCDRRRESNENSHPEIRTPLLGTYRSSDSADDFPGRTHHLEGERVLDTRVREARSTDRSGTRTRKNGARCSGDDRDGPVRRASGVKSSEGEPLSGLAVDVKRGKRKEIMLRFRPATRQELDCLGSRQGISDGELKSTMSPSSPDKASQTKGLREGRKSERGTGQTVEAADQRPSQLHSSEINCLDHPRGLSGQLQSRTRTFNTRPTAVPIINPQKTNPQMHNRGALELEFLPKVVREISSGGRVPSDSAPNTRETLAKQRDAFSSPFPVNTTLYHVARCMCEPCRRERSRRVPGPPPPPTFKIVGVEPRLVSATLSAHGFRRQEGGRAAGGGWRLLWSSQHLRSHAFRSLKHGQRINSFPRTYECTRKDALSRNMNRMSEVHGARHFGFAPRGFVLPAEREAVREAMRDAGEGLPWIVKPASSACGRGIFITKDFTDMLERGGSDGNWIAQRYVEDPLLLNGLKFDLRLYVAVTSFRPLRVYLHDEGLCRLATEPYSSDASSFNKRFVHLTNYSINRRSSRYEPGTTCISDDDEDRPHDSPPRSGSPVPTRDNSGGTVNPFSTPTRASGGAASSPADGTKLASAAGACARSTTAPSNANTVETRKSARPGVVDPVCAEGGAGEDQPNSGSGGNGRHCGDRRAGRKGGAGEGSPLPPGAKGDMGSKWSLKALRRRLAGMGVDVRALWGDIHDVVIKTLVAIEAQVSAAVEVMAIRRGSCFEMFGFDILVDRQLKPHLLEVNFAPSLNTHSDLDLAIKSKVVADLLTLAGIRGDPSRHHCASPASPATDDTAVLRRARRKPIPGKEAIDNGEETASNGSVTADGKPQVRAYEGEQRRRKRGGGGSEGNPTATATTYPSEPTIAPTAAEHHRVAPWGGEGGGDTGPATKARRGNSVGRARGRRCDGGNRDRSGGDGDKSGGLNEKFVPAWEGYCVSVDGGLPSADEMAAVAAESASELRRSGGFKLIFPVPGTAHKYLKFFDGPRPLERMLAPACGPSVPPGDRGEINASRRSWKGVGGGDRRRDNRRVGTVHGKRRVGREAERASSVSPVRTEV